MFLWAIYIFPWSVCLFCCRKLGGPDVGIYVDRSQTHECGNWDWGRAIPFLGTHKSKFLCSAAVLWVRTDYPDADLGFCEKVDPDPNPDFLKAKMRNYLWAKKIPNTVKYRSLGLQDPEEDSCTPQRKFSFSKHLNTRFFSSSVESSKTQIYNTKYSTVQGLQPCRVPRDNRLLKSKVTVASHW